MPFKGLIFDKGKRYRIRKQFYEQQIGLQIKLEFRTDNVGYRHSTTYASAVSDPLPWESSAMALWILIYPEGHGSAGRLKRGPLVGYNGKPLGNLILWAARKL